MAPKWPIWVEVSHTNVPEPSVPPSPLRGSHDFLTVPKVIEDNLSFVLKWPWWTFVCWDYWKIIRFWNNILYSNNSLSDFSKKSDISETSSNLYCLMPIRISRCQKMSPLLRMSQTRLGLQGQTPLRSYPLTLETYPLTPSAVPSNST